MTLQVGEAVRRSKSYSTVVTPSLLLSAAAILFVSCRFGGEASHPVDPAPGQATAATVSESADPETQVEISNVRIYLDPALVLHVRYLTGKFVRTQKGKVPTFDDKLSYIVSIDSAEIAITPAALTHALNTYVFNESGAPLKDLKLTIDGTRIKQTGKMKKGILVPFEMVGDINATPDGRIRLHPDKIKTAHLPVKGVMKLFGLDVANLINTQNTRGISVDENDIILDPGQIMPPPKLRGKITSVRVEGNQIVQIFGTRPPVQTRKGRIVNQLAYRGGVLAFGKLTMHDTDMRLIDLDPKDPFEFFPDHYKDHLVAGYSKTTRAGGLMVYMPDYNELSRSRPTP